jgi:hypothetical protein
MRRAPTNANTPPTIAAVSAKRLGSGGVDAAKVKVNHAAEVPSTRPPMLAAKLSPVPRRWTGYILGK